MSDRKDQSSGAFLVLWAYLMLLSIFLAPVIAAVITQGVD